MTRKYKISRELAESVISINMIDLVAQQVQEVLFKNGATVEFSDNHAIVSGIPIIDTIYEQVRITEGLGDTAVIETSNPVIAVMLLGFFTSDVSDVAHQMITDMGSFDHDEVAHIYKKDVCVELQKDTFRLMMTMRDAKRVVVELCR